MIYILYYLSTATVLTPLRLRLRGNKKNASARGHITYRIKGQKPSRLKQNTVVVKGVKCGLLLSLFAPKINNAPTVKSANFQRL